MQDTELGAKEDIKIKMLCRLVFVTLMQDRVIGKRILTEEILVGKSSALS